MAAKDVNKIEIINKAIPPSQHAQQQQHQQLFTPHFHGSSKSLNLMIGYKTQPQYPIQTVDTRSQRDVYNINSYTGDLNYATTPGSNRDIHSLYSGNEDNNINKPFLPSRQNSIVYSQNPRFSTYAVPHTVILNHGSPELAKNESRDIPHYGKLAWFACIFFFPLGIIALRKHFETRKYRYGNPDKALAASDVTRFFGTFAILLGIILYALIVIIRLRLSYESGENFI